MLDLYTSPVAHGRAPGILLAELGLSYGHHVVGGESEAPGVLEGYPSPALPTLVDRDPELGRTVVFESGAILQYLAEKNHRLLPSMLGAHRADVISWVYWEASGPRLPFAELSQHERAVEHPALAHALALERSRTFVATLDRHLVDRDYIADEYSLADVACYASFATVAAHCPLLLEPAAEVRRWLHRIGARPAVRQGMRFEQAGKHRVVEGVN
jgi:GST-like protein